MVELVVHCDHLMVLSVQAVEDKGLLVAGSDKLMVQRGGVNGVMVMLRKAGVVLHHISQAVWSKWGWSVTTSHGSQTGLY